MGWTHQLAQKELQKINTYKAPRDKLVCILNCCRVINNLLLNVSLATNDNPSGADDFLPILIYIVIKVSLSLLFLCFLTYLGLCLKLMLATMGNSQKTYVISVFSFLLGIVK